jgi:signal transduction histidine kinase/DNA-binding response OmpR family regulator
VILDHNFLVKSWSGDCSYYGYEAIQIGKDCRDCLLFLVGLNAQDAIHLRFIETPNARAVHVKLFVDSDELTLVLLDATEQRISHTVMQQKSNDLALMQIKQNRLIENLQHLEKQLEAKRRQAEQANQLKSQFIATMSHEFRTPLTSILGYTSRLKQSSSLDSGLDSEPLKYLSSVERGAQHLLSLVENLLDHSQIEVGSLSINPIATNVSLVLDKIRSIFEPLAEDKHLNFTVEIKTEIPESLMLDEMRFRQILVNLVSNAIKYTDKGSVHVQASWANDGLTVSVEDTGHGIAEADQQRIFTAFEQLGENSGTGLGLSIAKHLVAAMGGQLFLTSVLGKGSRFELCLPTRQVVGHKHESQSELRGNHQKRLLKSVLIVEDDPDIMALLQGVFDEAECLTLTANNGNDALDLALSEWPDLVLLDLNLPGMTGFEVIKRLRDNNFTNPVFIQSAWVSTEYKAKAIAAGCNEYLLKPLDITHLMVLVSDYFIKNVDPGMPIERYQRLCQRFIDLLPEKLQILEQLEINNQHCWTTLTRQEIHTYAHRLAGSAELYGMSSITRLSKQLDQLLIDYDRLDSKSSHTQLQVQISNTISMLSHQIGQAISND